MSRSASAVVCENNSSSAKSAITPPATPNPGIPGGRAGGRGGDAGGLVRWEGLQPLGRSD